MQITIEIKEGQSTVITRVVSSEPAPSRDDTGSSSGSDTLDTAKSTPGGVSDGGPAPALMMGDSSHGVLENSAVVSPDAPAPFTSPGAAAPSGSDTAAGAAPGVDEPIRVETTSAEYDEPAD
ncbi:MAG: hypothetical protein ACLGH0_11430 [Thermoanaerobaculia bacterium]